MPGFHISGKDGAIPGERIQAGDRVFRVSSEDVPVTPEKGWRLIDGADTFTIEEVEPLSVQSVVAWELLGRR